MNCKNCTNALEASMNFCHKCGANVVRHRITARSIWQNFLADFWGWDNRYLRTFMDMLRHPEWVLKGYLDGVRIRYTKPFLFVAIGTTVSAICFNLFSDQYMDIVREMIEIPKLEVLMDAIEVPSSERNVELSVEFQELLIHYGAKLLKYYTLITFLSIPFVALFSKRVFGPRLNYGEYLVVNCYINGTFILLSIPFFFLEIATGIGFLMVGNFVTTFGLYLYSFKRLLDLSWKQVIFKVFKFIGLILLGAIVLFALGYVIGKYGPR